MNDIFIVVVVTCQFSVLSFIKCIFISHKTFWLGSFYQRWISLLYLFYWRFTSYC